MEYRLRVKADKREPSDYKQHRLEIARREMGNKLYGILYSQKLPAVVDITETQLREYDHEVYDEIEIRTTITPVQHQHITMAHAELTWQPIALVGKHPVKRTLAKILNSIGRRLR